MEITILIFGIILGGLLCYFILQPKIKNTEKINENIIKENNKIELLNKNLVNSNIQLKQEEEVLLDRVNKINLVKASLEGQKDELIKNIQLLQEQADNSAQVIYDKSYQLMQEKLSQAAEQLSKDYEALEEKCKNDYLITLRDSGAELAETLALKIEEIRSTQIELDTLRAKVDAAIEAAKREEEKLLELDKYKIILSDLDLLEINRLREIAPYFRNARAIYKIIWESYYRNATTDLLNRIVGAGIKTGVYKITNLKNHKIYIGQAADLSSRLKEHIKCGLGIDTPNNILYTAMTAEGVENFSFEGVEECTRDALNDREIFWIDYYRSREFGYNMTRGGARK